MALTVLSTTTRYGNRAWSLNLEWKGKAGFGDAGVHDWNANGMTRGTARSFENFHFVSVRDAGHMVCLPTACIPCALCGESVALRLATPVQFHECCEVRKVSYAVFMRKFLPGECRRHTSERWGIAECVFVSGSCAGCDDLLWRVGFSWFSS